jgi:hypothetical protein
VPLECRLCDIRPLIFSRGKLREEERQATTAEVPHSDSGDRHEYGEPIHDKVRDLGCDVLYGVSPGDGDGGGRRRADQESREQQTRGQQATVQTQT